MKVHKRGRTSRGGNASESKMPADPALPTATWEPALAPAACHAVEDPIRSKSVGDDASWAGEQQQRDPICKIVIPVPHVASALTFWQHLIGLDRYRGHKDGCCLVASPWHLLELRHEEEAKMSTPAVSRSKVKLGLTFPETWLPGVAQVAADFGSGLHSQCTCTCTSSSRLCMSTSD